MKINKTTYMAKVGEVQAKWHVVDATDKVLGRLSTRIAMLLMGKHKPIYTPHVLCGDFVVVINAEKIRLTGAKWSQKMYKHYSGYPNGQKVRPAAEMVKRHPEFLIQEAVRRMLPKGQLGRKMSTRLKVYAGPEHPHQAQKAEPLNLG